MHWWRVLVFGIDLATEPNHQVCSCRKKKTPPERGLRYQWAKLVCRVAISRIGAGSRRPQKEVLEYGQVLEVSVTTVTVQIMQRAGRQKRGFEVIHVAENHRAGLVKVRIATVAVAVRISIGLIRVGMVDAVIDSV